MQQSMDWIDGHLDLAYLAVSGRDLRLPPNQAEGCLSLPSLREAGFGVVFGTIFTEPGVTSPDEPWGYPSPDDLDGAEEAGRRQLRWYQELEASGELSIVRRAAELEESGAPLKVVLLMEGADPIRRPEDVGAWFDDGLRMVGMTWSAGTRYAGGNGAHGPLTALGRELVAAMDEAGIVHDASHLADDSLAELLELARGPIVATHSNCRTLMDGVNQRHLRDDQIKSITERGGIIGLNLYTSFLARGRRATIDDCVSHVNHVSDLAGDRRHIALGSDMDGGFGPAELPVSLDRPTAMMRLAEALCDAGWTEADVQGFASGNWRRFLEESLPGSPR